METKWFGFLVLCACVCASTSRYIGDGFQLITNVLSEYLQTGISPLYWQNPSPNTLQSDYDLKAVNDSQICLLCDLVADFLIIERKLGVSDVQISAEAHYICTVLEIENSRVCNGVIKPVVEIFTYMIDNDEDISGSRICGLVLSEKNCDTKGNYQWTIDVPPGITIEKPKADATKTFNILHISDIHYDPRYTPGKAKQCGEPLCCQDDQEDGTDASDSCGYWSEYSSADVPLHTLQEAFNHISTTQEFDYIYYTGDTVNHRVWGTSIEANSLDITTVTEQFKKYFDVPVYPVLGNHEPHPVNAWSSEGVVDAALSTRWLFDLAAEQWGEWLTDEAKRTISIGGYYSVSPRKGLRVVVLNNNVCYNENWWLIKENKDPYGQLAWLSGVLLEAEKALESVHILMHMPTGTGSCMSSWSREYGRLIRRFANTITGQFTGHSHKDEMWVYYDSSDPTLAVSVSWNGASLIADKANPSYKLYQIDEGTFDVLDFEEWTFNLTRSNLDAAKNVEWYKLYSFKDAYGVDDLQPADVDNLLTRMTKDHSLIQKYYNYKFRNSDVAVKEGCDEHCEKDLLCNIVTTLHDDDEHCKRLQQLYDENKT
ncbi:hypothetical protein NQ315_007749 [Exocentrus adspersus]|uniref:Sphingomyelin phosphodiesterase n=1 Tax=Exocentrus adspersus TaxID=1586481 RepID=A0AAV8W8B2_9CUCU|nr:hypothetical protein NQ315_007749 [Exocentrus adspersus]